jgi:hypothetical protein
LLFVLSKDFGSLGMALAFLRGQEFATRAMLLLPELTYEVNKHSLPVSAASFSTLADVQAAVEAHEPDLVFLVSGYLFSNDGLLSDEALDVLVRQLRDRGCQIITDDPFVGLAPRLKRSDLDSRLLFFRKPLSERLSSRFLFWLSRNQPVVTTKALYETVHLYPTPVRDIDGTNGIRRISFFNSDVVRPVVMSGQARPGSDLSESTRRWLFVISSTDLGVQEWLLGASAFDKLVIQKLEQTRTVGRRATLIAPSSLVGRLAPAFAAESDVELMSWCPHEEYVSRLVDAEYVFYWNAFSCSLLLRCSNGLPAFLFDRGHLPRVIKPYYETATRVFYRTWAPPYLDQKRRLEPAELAVLAEQQKPELDRLLEYWKSSPPPTAVIDNLLSGSRDLRSRGPDQS